MARDVKRAPSAPEIVELVHERDNLLREANALTQLAKDVESGNKEFGYQDVFGIPSEKTFQRVPFSQRARIVELAKEHVGEIRARADEIMRKLGGADVRDW